MLNHKQKYPNILKIFIILILVTPVLVMVLPTVVANAGPWVSDGVSYGSESASSDTFEIKTDSMPVVITWVLEIVFLLILCILWLVCAILNAVTNGLIGGYLDTIILQGTGVSQESSTLINFYTFRLANKNIYGTAVSVLYPLLSGVVIMLIVVRFFSGMSRASFSTSSQESRGIMKDTVTGSILAIFAIALMPQFYQMGLGLMHRIIAIIKPNGDFNSLLGELVGGKGKKLLDLNIQMNSGMAWEEAVGSFVLSLTTFALIVGSVILTFLMVYEYVMVCLSFSMHFLAFPFRVTVSAAKVKDSISEWLKQFYELLMTPVIDIILLRFMFLLIEKAAGMSGKDGGAGIIPAAFISVIILFAFFPLRKVMRMYMGLNATGAETLSRGVAGNLAKAALAGRTVAKIAKDHKEKAEGAKSAEQAANAEDEAAQKENDVAVPNGAEGSADMSENPGAGSEMPQVSSVFDGEENEGEKPGDASAVQAEGAAGDSAEGTKTPGTAEGANAAAASPGADTAGRKTDEGNTAAPGAGGTNGTEGNNDTGAVASADGSATENTSENNGPNADKTEKAESIHNEKPDAKTASVSDSAGDDRQEARTAGAAESADNGADDTKGQAVAGGVKGERPDGKVSGVDGTEEKKPDVMQGSDEHQPERAQGPNTERTQSANTEGVQSTEGRTGVEDTSDAGQDEGSSVINDRSAANEESPENINEVSPGKKTEDAAAEERNNNNAHENSADMAGSTAGDHQPKTTTASSGTETGSGQGSGRQTAESNASDAGYNGSSESAGGSVSGGSSDGSNGSKPVSLAEYRQSLRQKHDDLDSNMADTRANIDSLGQQERELEGRQAELKSAYASTRDAYGSQIAQQKQIEASEKRRAVEAASPAERKEHQLAAAVANENAVALAGKRDAELAEINAQSNAVGSQLTAVRNMKAAESGKLSQMQTQQRTVSENMREADSMAKAAAGTRYVPGSPQQEAIHDIAAKHATLANFDSAEYRGAFSHEEMAAMYRERAAQTRAAARSGMIRSIAGGVGMGLAGAMLGGGIGLTGGAMAGMSMGNESADSKLREELSTPNSARNKRQYEAGRGNVFERAAERGGYNVPGKEERTAQTGMGGTTVYTRQDPIRGARTADGTRGDTIVRSYVKDKDGNLHLRESNVINSKTAQSYERAANEKLLADAPVRPVSREERREQEAAEKYRNERSERLGNIRKAMDMSAIRAGNAIRNENTHRAAGALYVGSSSGKISDAVRRSEEKTRDVISRDYGNNGDSYTEPPSPAGQDIFDGEGPSRYPDTNEHFSSLDRLNYAPEHGDTLPAMAERLSQSMYSPKTNRETDGIKKVNEYLGREVPALSSGRYDDQLRDYAAIAGNNTAASKDMDEYLRDRTPEKAENLAGSVAVSNATLSKALSESIARFSEGSNPIIPSGFVYNSDATGSEKEMQDELIDDITEDMVDNIRDCVQKGLLDEGDDYVSPLYSAVRFERQKKSEFMYKTPYSLVTDAIGIYKPNTKEYARARDYIKEYAVRAFFRQQEKAVKRNSGDDAEKKMRDLFGKP